MAKKGPAYELFTNCHELPMDRMITALCDGDLTALVKSGTAPEVVLQLHFQDLYQEFISLRGDKNSLAVLEILKRIAYAKTKKIAVEQCVEVLRIRYVPDIAGELKSMGYAYAFDPTDKEGFEKDLKRTLSASKKLSSEIALAEKELESFKSKETSDTNKGGFTRQYFDAVNSSLSKYMGFHVKESEISVARWCAMMKEYDRHIEVMNAQNNNLLNKKAHG